MVMSVLPHRRRAAANSGHLYWRIQVNTAQSSPSQVTIAEIQMYVTGSVIDQCTGGTAGASDYQSTNTPDKAFDDSGSTGWNSAIGGFPHSIWYQFAAGKNITSFKIQIRTGISTGPKTFDLHYSDNGSSWTFVKSFSATWSAGGEEQTFTV